MKPQTAHSYAASTIWLENNVNLTNRPLLFTTNIDSQQPSALKVLLCDQLMFCVPANTITPATKKNVPWNAQFDPHPNRQSPVVRLLFILNGKLLSETTVELAIVNFGDPCYQSICSENQPNREGCKANPFETSANNFEAACPCKDDFTGKDCLQTNYCPTKSKVSLSKCPFIN